MSGERDLISSLRTSLVSSRATSLASRLGGRRKRRDTLIFLGSRGVGDDCAILRPPSGMKCLSRQTLRWRSVHFRREWHSPESVGHRCLARGLSDLAAMGAKPMAAFLSLALPVELVRSRAGHPSWRERFFNGFLALAEKHKVPLAGGDTAQSPLIERHRGGIRSAATGLALMDIVLVGTAPRGRRFYGYREGGRSHLRHWIFGRCRC